MCVRARVSVCVRARARVHDLHGARVRALVGVNRSHLISNDLLMNALHCPLIRSQQNCIETYLVLVAGDTFTTYMY